MKIAAIQPGKFYFSRGMVWKCVGIHPSVPKAPELESVWPHKGQVKIFDSREVEREVQQRELDSYTKQ